MPLHFPHFSHMFWFSPMEWMRDWWSIRSFLMVYHSSTSPIPMSFTIFSNFLLWLIDSPGLQLNCWFLWFARFLLLWYCNLCNTLSGYVLIIITLVNPCLKIVKDWRCFANWEKLGGFPSFYFMSASIAGDTLLPQQLL